MGTSLEKPEEATAPPPQTSEERRLPTTILLNQGPNEQYYTYKDLRKYLETENTKEETV